MKKTVVLIVFALSLAVGAAADCFNANGTSFASVSKDANGNIVGKGVAYCGVCGTGCTYKIRLTIKDSSGNNIQGSPFTQGFSHPCNGMMYTDSITRKPANGTYDCKSELLDGNGARVIDDDTETITLP